MSLTIAIVGRPNVGKSTLFNRLVGRRSAIVHDTPGVTRDRKVKEAWFGSQKFELVDTAGFEEKSSGSLETRMSQQTKMAVTDADIILMMVDARAGITPGDQGLAHSIRRYGKTIILVANKCEGKAGEAGYYDAFELGLGNPIAISAEHAEGISDLYDQIRIALENINCNPNDVGEDVSVASGALKLAIVGRPNVGKSSLINKLTGEERLITGPEAGITRDSISVRWSGEGREIELVDTAGLRRKSRVTQKLEYLSVKDTLNSIRLAEVVALVVDASLGIEKQDLAIAATVIKEGRALLIVANKWDLVKDSQSIIGQLNEKLLNSLPQARGVKIVTVSALTGYHSREFRLAIFSVYSIWNQRISTGRVNQWLVNVVDHHPPPAVRNRRPRFRYITQAKARPPTFVLFVSRPELVGESYIRYLENDLRSAFGLSGTPIRILLRKGKNPYTNNEFVKQKSR